MNVMEPNTQVPVPEKHFMNMVTPLSKTLALVLFVALPLVTLYIGYQAGLKTGILSGEMSGAVQVIPATESKSSIRSYSDPETKISFSYPAQWGEVVVSDERGTCDKNYTTDPCNLKTYGFSAFKNCAGCQPTSFMAAETLGHQNNTPARGPGWQDSAGSITASYLTACTQESSCEVVENDKKVQLAKTVRTGYFSGDDPPLQTATTYKVYVPNNPYYGVLLSDIFTEDLEIKKLFSDTVVASLSVSSQ